VLWGQSGWDWNLMYTIENACGTELQEVDPAAFRTVGEPGFALSPGQTLLTVVIGLIISRHGPPRAQHHAMASGNPNISSDLARQCW